MKILITGLLISTMAFSMLDRSVGDWGSGGGNAIVCFGDFADGQGGVIDHVNEIKKNKNIIPDKYLAHIRSIELYDLYEAKKRRGLDSSQPEIINIDSSEEIYDYIERLERRFRNFNIKISQIVKEAKRIVPNENISFNKGGLKYQNDLGAVALPSSKCLISTIGAQVNYFDHYQVHIDERLYNHPKHSKQSKATLILHELIYAFGRSHFEHTDSGSTRELVRILLSYDKSINEGSVSKFLVNARFVSPGYELSTSSKYAHILKSFNKVHEQVKVSIRDLLTNSNTSNIIHRFHELIGYNHFNTPWHFFSDAQILLIDKLDNSSGEALIKWQKLSVEYDVYAMKMLQTFKTEIENSFWLFNFLDEDDLAIQHHSYRHRIHRLMVSITGSLNSLDQVEKKLKTSIFRLSYSNAVQEMNVLFFEKYFSRLDCRPMTICRLLRRPLSFKEIIPKE